MGLNKTVLKTRTTTAIIYAVVMLGGLLFNLYLFGILCLVILAGTVYEFWKLAAKQQEYAAVWLGVFGSIFLMGSIVLFFSTGLHFNSMDGNFVRFSPIVPCCIIFSIWINDTMAYIVGSLAGKTAISKWSPKKTWEGTIGGIVLSIAVIGVGFQFLPFGQNELGKLFQQRQLFNTGFAMIAGTAAIFGTLGDLAESRLKRIANVKDSGNFMPGHGGFLDRFDSLLFAGPAVFILLELLAFL